MDFDPFCWPARGRCVLRDNFNYLGVISERAPSITESEAVISAQRSGGVGGTAFHRHKEEVCAVTASSFLGEDAAARCAPRNQVDGMERVNGGRPRLTFSARHPALWSGPTILVSGGEEEEDEEGGNQHLLPPPDAHRFPVEPAPSCRCPPRRSISNTIPGKRKRKGSD